MKQLILLITVLFLLTSYSYVSAAQKYNPMTGKWETVPKDAEMKYDPMNKNWHYHHPDAQQEYNPMEHKWEWNDGINPDDTN